MALDPATIRHIVGPLDDDVIARIARTGISRDELKEAALRVTGGEDWPTLETGGSSPVHEVVLLLERLEADEDLNAECMD